MAEGLQATPQEAYAAIRDDGAVLIDVREQWEHDELRIPGGTLMPLGEIPGRVDEVPAGRPVYLYCRNGGRSGRAAEYLRDHGRPLAFNVAGGIEAWTEAGLPVEG